MKFYGLKDIDSLPQLSGLSQSERLAMKVVAQVLPFRVNNYVVENLIDWSNLATDPIYRLTFMQKEMLTPSQFTRMEQALNNRALSVDDIKSVANSIRLELNPHPAGQLTTNVPKLNGTPVPGLQHKYRETVLVFPSEGQTCHAYCTFCFRWPQFVGMPDFKFATDRSMSFQDYVAQHREITDVLITGGDPMIMNAKKLAAYIEPFLKAECNHVQNIRIGSKSLSYWPFRFTTDKDADDILRLFEKVVKAGKHLAFMMHVDHWRELSTPAVCEAIKRVQSTGAIIRSQTPLIRGINDDSKVWVKLWQDQVKLGIVPYYMFVERNTGAQHYFAVPLARALDIYQQAIQQVSGLSRTVRGPSMSTYQGKVCIDGKATIRDEAVLVLSFLQARNADWVKRPFFAKYDEKATWFDELQPAFHDPWFFSETEDNKATG